MLFNELNLPEEILRAVEDMGFSEATEIQSKAIPVMLEGKGSCRKVKHRYGKDCRFRYPRRSQRYQRRKERC